MKKQFGRVLAGGALVAASVPAFATATSIIDYTTIMSSVSTELGLGIVAAAAVVGLIWGARVGIRFVKSLMA